MVVGLINHGRNYGHSQAVIFPAPMLAMTTTSMQYRCLPAQLQLCGCRTDTVLLE